MKYIIIFLLLVLAIVGWYYVTDDMMPDKQAEREAAVSRSLEQQTIVEDYEIIIDIPYTNVEKIDVINALKIELAKSELIELAIETKDKQTPYTLEMIGQLYPETRTGLASQVVTTNSYTGGAHGSTVFSSATYSPETSRLYDLGQIISQDNESAQFVFSQVQESTKELDLDPTWLQEGSGLEWDNYQTFYVTDEGITFIFEQYQISSYSDGPIYVSVSWESLQEYLRGGIKKKLGFTVATETGTSTGTTTATTTQ